MKNNKQLNCNSYSSKEFDIEIKTYDKMNISLEDFELFADYIYQKVGIRFEYKKVQLISNRIKKRLDAIGGNSVKEYLQYLKFKDTNNTEFQTLLNNLTVNETYFFRDFPQMTSFSDHCLPELINRKIQNRCNTINIWSVGCSSGEEPYTIGIILSEILADVSKWNINITALDVDDNILQNAMQGKYGSRSIKDVPEEYLNKYFNYTDSQYCIMNSIKKLVTFEHVNIMDKISMRNHTDYDVIFCRNVLIYFDEKSRRQVVDNLYTSLNKGGYIYLGSSESMGKISNAFKLNKMGTYLVYSKE